MKTIGAVFFKGLAALLPPTITIYFLYWLWKTAEQQMQPLFERYELKYYPGFGLASVVVIVFAIGLLTNAWIVRTFIRMGERIVDRIPLVKTLYGSIRDLMNFFDSSSSDRKMSQVVVVRPGGGSLRLLGLVTREDFSDLPRGIGGADLVAVYLPMSYQLGGFTTMVPREHVEPVDMSVEDAMRFAVTAGMTASSDSAAK